MRDIGVQAGACEQLVGGLVELLVAVGLHEPGDHADPHPRAGGVERLDIPVAVQGVEEEEAGLCIVLRRSYRIHEDAQQHHDWRPRSLRHSVPRALHLLPVQLVHHALGEEQGVVVYHHQHVVQRLIRRLVFPEIQAN